MNEKMITRLKWLCYMSLFVCACWFLYVCLKSYDQVFNNHIFGSGGSHSYSFTIFSLYLVFTFGLIGVFVTFFFNVLRGIRREELFPKVNVKVINIGAIIIFLQTMATDNFDQVFVGDGTKQIELTSNPIVLSLAVIVFGAMYKIACFVAAEHDLTV